MLKRPDIDTRFGEIYDKNFWSSKESGSGEGSEFLYTQSLREWLIETVPKLGVEVFLDAACGDFNWMKKVLPILNVDYIGLDIVPSVIEINNRKYSSDKVKFAVSNICNDPLPKCDLIMVRDCLFHLSYGDINKFLGNLSRLDYKYLLTTTHVVVDDFANRNIISGDFRLINLFAPPFSFDSTKVIDRVNDYPKGYKLPREIILVEKKFVPSFVILPN